MGDLPYPFSATDEAPFYTVALGNGEYVWVTLAGDYRALQADGDLLYGIACNLYADLHPHLTRSDCEAEVLRWFQTAQAMRSDGD